MIYEYHNIHYLWNLPNGKTWSKKVALAQKVALTKRYPINVRKLSSDHCVVNTGH